MKTPVDAAFTYKDETNKDVTYFFKGDKYQSVTFKRRMINKVSHYLYNPLIELQ